MTPADDCRRKFGNWTCWEFILSSWIVSAVCTHPSTVVTQFTLQFCRLYVTGAENWKLGHDWRLVRSHRRHDATQLRCRQIVQTRRDSLRLSPTSCKFNTHCRCNSTRQLSCVGVGGVYWNQKSFISSCSQWLDWYNVSKLLIKMLG